MPLNPYSKEALIGGGLPKFVVVCQYYDVTAHHECGEPTAEWVADKERGNFCGMFRPFAGERAAGDDVASAKAKLEELFKKK